MRTMMLIGLDEKRIADDGYEPQVVWGYIDFLFCVNAKWTKEPELDGTVMYVSGDFGDDEEKLGEVWYAVFRRFAKDTHFMKYCNEWLGFHEDDEERYFSGDLLALAGKSVFI